MSRKECSNAENDRQAERCKQDSTRSGICYAHVPVWVKAFDGSNVTLNAKKRGSDISARDSPSLPPLPWGGRDMWKDCPSDMDVDGAGKPIVGSNGTLLLSLDICRNHGLGWTDPKWPACGGANTVEYRALEILPTRITVHGYDTFSDDPVEGEIELFNEQMIDPTQTEISWGHGKLKLNASEYVFTQIYYTSFPSEENLERAASVILKTGGTPKELANAWKAVEVWSARLERRRAGDEADAKIKKARELVDTIIKRAKPPVG